MKGKARGTLARLEALEAAERERIAADVAVKEGLTERALSRLSRADRAAVREHLDAQEAGGAWWAEVCRAADALTGQPLEDLAGEAARTWWQKLEDTPDGVPYDLAPAGAAVYFEREAARCDTVKEDAPGEALPEGVSLEAVQTAARWSAGWWRYTAVYALEMGEGVQA